MLTMFADGGPPMWIVLLFGIIALVDAVLLVRRCDQRKMLFLRAMTVAEVMAMISGFSAGVARSMNAVPLLPPAMKEKWPLLVARGTAESLANVILGTTLLSLAWFIAAIAIRRQVSSIQSSEPA
jgi:hypothetical protein